MHLDRGPYKNTEIQVQTVSVWLSSEFHRKPPNPPEVLSAPLNSKVCSSDPRVPSLIFPLQTFFLLPSQMGKCPLIGGAGVLDLSEYQCLTVDSLFHISALLCPEKRSTEETNEFEKAEMTECWIPNFVGETLDPPPSPPQMCLGFGFREMRTHPGVFFALLEKSS